MLDFRARLEWTSKKQILTNRDLPKCSSLFHWLTVFFRCLATASFRRTPQKSRPLKGVVREGPDRISDETRHGRWCPKVTGTMGP